ncbi:unnamed protein product [Periconia digitata]|uniref:EF-hand domain-containing protein n=1 Tax=Periconia digitata TaxID=1303443 RepID=A0A9W4UV00_9PLEO|nr:unnamed protein product [Periconia digitata]
MRRLATRLGIARPSFDQWCSTVTIEEVHEMTTELMVSGVPNDVPCIFTSAELALLKQLLGTFSIDKSGELSMDDIYSHIYQNHPSLRTQVQAAYPIISILFLSHCSFPFTSRVPLTKNTVIRSIGFLTSRSNYMFSYTRKFSSEYAIPRREVLSNIQFIFSALAQPERCTGVPTRADMLDVVSRIHYPLPSNPCMAKRRPISQLYPVADRLLASSSGSELPPRETLTVSVPLLRPLAELCDAIQNDGSVDGWSFLEGKNVLTHEEFVQWATAISLTVCIEKLFEVFLVRPN